MFAAVSRELEEPSYTLSMDDGGADDFRAVDPFGRLLLKLKQRRFLKERDKHISQIQALPGFDNFKFLTSPFFHTLRSAGLVWPCHHRQLHMAL
jgi:hypothetical protein